MTTDAGYFDQWYAAMTDSPVKEEITRRHLGLPPRLLSTSLLSWDGIAEVVATLDLRPGDTLLDLACGRGGYGLEIAQRTGARLVGVDFSGEAVRQARELAARWGSDASFVTGDLADTGLDTGSVDAVIVIDAIQFAPAPAAAYGELRRVLRPGGRVALTAWEAVDPDDDVIPARLRTVDLDGGLRTAGFIDVRSVEHPDWRAVERAMWHEAADLDPGDDPALTSFHEEGTRSMAIFDRLTRMLATATAPSG